MRNKFHTVPGILHLDRGHTDERSSRPTGSFGGCICADRFGVIIRPTCFIQQTTDRRRCKPKCSHCCCISYIVVSIVIAMCITIFLAIAIPKHFWFKVNTDSCLRARYTVFPRICTKNVHCVQGPERGSRGRCSAAVAAKIRPLCGFVHLGRRLLACVDEPERNIDCRHYGVESARPCHIDIIHAALTYRLRSPTQTQYQSYGVARARPCHLDIIHVVLTYRLRSPTQTQYQSYGVSRAHLCTVLSS